jgi:transcriptional regulator with XRE-family HTH domain
MDNWRDRMRRRLQELKDSEGTTRDDVAERAGVTVQSLSNWLNGHREPRSVEDWERLAAALKVRPSWLVFGEGAPDDESAALSRRILDLPAESRRALNVLLNHSPA